MDENKDLEVGAVEETPVVDSPEEVEEPIKDIGSPTEF